MENIPDQSIEAFARHFKDEYGSYFQDDESEFIIIDDVIDDDDDDEPVNMQEFFENPMPRWNRLKKDLGWEF